MALTVRLDPKADRTLTALSKRKGLSRSDIVREALAQYNAAESGAESPSRPYDSWLDVIGVVNLGGRDPRRTTGEQFAAIIRKRHRARRAR